MNDTLEKHEELARSLNNPDTRAAYAARSEGYRPGPLSRVLGWLLVASGTLFYGRKPSYAKCKAIEVIARVPYQSWEMAAYTLLTALYNNERRAVALARFGAFSHLAQDNEMMHVVVISQIAKRLRCTGFIRHTLLPFFFSFIYFITSYLLVLISKKTALELNYLFESHAYHQYQAFLDAEEKRLRQTPVMSDFLAFYGRRVANEYELFELIRNDELIHRHRSLEELGSR